MRLDVTELVRQQIARDRARTAAFPFLRARKIARMRASAHGFLRGAAPLYYQILRARPELAEGPPGQGWLAGDLHVENFGAYRPESLAGRHADRVVFDLNDFDDAFTGPWRLDVLRLLTSVLLSARARGLDGTQAVELGERLLAAHGTRQVPGPPRPVRALIERTSNRSRADLLDERTEVSAGRRRFLRGERYRPLPAALLAPARQAFADYVARLPAADREPAEAFEVCDLAFRVAGTGSLGVLRIAVLTRGKARHRGGWIFDLKEEFGRNGARRVLSAQEACLRHPPRMAGTTRLGSRSMLVRRLSPEEDKLDLAHADTADLDALVAYLGALSGSAHRRGASGRAARPWSDGDRSRLLDAAVALAGLHESCYLVFCKLTRSRDLT